MTSNLTTKKISEIDILRIENTQLKLKPLYEQVNKLQDQTKEILERYDIKLNPLNPYFELDTENGTISYSELQPQPVSEKIVDGQN